MRKFRDIPIRWKLTLVSMTTSAAVLLLASAAFFVFDFVSYRAHTLERVEALADVIGANTTAAISFRDPRVAERILASLAVENHVLQGAVYDATGTVMASYRRRGLAKPLIMDRVPAESMTVDDDSLSVFRPIELEGERIGTAMITVSLASTRRRVLQYLIFVGAIVAASLAAAWVLAFRLQSHVSTPIMNLTQIASRISREHDYSIRAGQGADDEVGTLMTGFNTMLDQIETSSEELRHSRDRLRSLAHELVLTEERERRLLARGLHDSICQLLCVANLRLRTVAAKEEQTRVAAELQEIDALITEALTEARTLTFQLSPPELYDVGIDAALAQLVQRVRNRYHMNVTFDSHVSECRLAEDVSAILYRAVRELLMNAYKHAGAGEVRVTIAETDHLVAVAVADNGEGFDPSAHVQRREHGGFGLFSIRERMGQIGGSITITSEPGKGTRVVLQAPGQTDRSLRPGPAPAA